MTAKRLGKSVCLTLSLLLGMTEVGCSSGQTQEVSSEASVQKNQKAESQAGFSDSENISQGSLRKIVYALVSSAENSTIHYQDCYSYIEDIDDGRGYTAGLIGFTSGTGDLYDLIREYVKLKPDDNELSSYLGALKNDIGSDSHEGLGDSFVKAWKEACKNPEMIEAQNNLINSMYMDPAISYSREDGLGPLGQYIYYDALVVHGPADAEDDPQDYDDSFQGIRDAAIREAKTPSEGGSEAEYLEAFLKARTKIMEKEEAHKDLSRIDAQKKFILENNEQLALPLKWKMYGDSYELTEQIVQDLPAAD